ncbi:MAG: class I SAM-dependent methyltransferase [Nitrospinae bacterium]|nr:class I SAM-dependent methyltransferase [Nitrospinota bacterium]
MNTHWPLPANDTWSTPFAQALIKELDLFPGAQVLDIAAGGGIPAFYIAEQVGPDGRVLAIDINQRQILHARSSQGSHLPWLQFEAGDMRFLPPTLPQFDRITGNISFMFFRPDRSQALGNLLKFLKPGGQIVLTFPSLGTFDSLWTRVKNEMAERKLDTERQALDEYIAERPSADHARKWLQELGMEKVEVTESPLEVPTGPGREFLEHPLLRGGFLDDVYECFQDQGLAEEFMTAISRDTASFTPLYAQRCVMSGWAAPKKSKT